MGSLLRLLRPIRYIKRKGVLSGVLGGNTTWLVLGGVVWFFGKVKELVGFGTPEPVYVEELSAGQRLVIAHSEPARRRRRRSRRRA